MTSRRRRSRTTVQSSIVTLVVAVGVWALLSSGVLSAGAAADADAGADSAPGAGPTTSITDSTPATGTAPSDEPTIETTSVPAASLGEPSRASRPTGTAAAAGGTRTDAVAARALLATLPVKGRSPSTGYDREADFGTAWLDVDHNGCDTRNDVLARDLTHVVRQGPCRVLSGDLVSPYTGAAIAFVRGNTTSTLVQIDHVVALENAWRTGAQRLSQAQREALANDPENLFAVDGRSNAQKRSADAATWLPAAKGFRCEYVAHQITVKATYRLWVVPAERDAMERVLSTC